MIRNERYISYLVKIYDQIKALRKNINLLSANNIEHIDISIDGSHSLILINADDVNLDDCRQYLIDCLTKKLNENLKIIEKYNADSPEV